MLHITFEICVYYVILMIIYDAIVVTSARVPEAIRECTMTVSTVLRPVAPQVAPCQAVMEIFLAHEGDRGHGNITRVQSSRGMFF